MNQLKAMIKYELIDIYQRKSVFILSVLLPVFFFLIFSSLMSKQNIGNVNFYIRDYMLSMTTFSLTSFALITFPIEMVYERQSGWMRSLFRTPLNPVIYYLCKVFKILLMYIISIMIVFLIGYLFKGVEMSIIEWFISFIGLLFGGTIFLSLGVLLSQINDSQKVSTIGNIIYLGLALIGGLWFHIETFPDWLKEIAKYSPTYNFKNIAAGQFSSSYPWHSLFILLIYALIFIITTYVIKRKSEVS